MKRAVALFLSLLFVFTLVPVSALAVAGTATVTCSSCSILPAGPFENDATATVTAVAPSDATKVFTGFTASNNTGCTIAFTGYDYTARTATVTFSGMAEGAAITPTITANYDYPLVTHTSECTLSGADRVPIGTAFTATAAAAPAGKKLVGITVTPASAVSTAFNAETRTIGITMPAQDVTVRADYEYTITTTDCTTSPAGSAVAGTKVTLTATPPVGYAFSAWEVKDASSTAVTVTSDEFTMPESAVTAKAICVPEHTLTVNGGKITKVGTTVTDAASMDVKEGATVEVKATLPTSAAFKKWSAPLPAGWTGTDPITGAMPAGDLELTAVFSYTLTLPTGATATGADITGTAPTYQVEPGTVVTVKSGKSQQDFKAWTVSSGGITLADPTASITTFTMPSAAVTLAESAKTKYAISAVGAEYNGGAVSIPIVALDDGAAYVAGTALYEGDTLTLKAPKEYTSGSGTSAVYYIFDRWETTTGGTIASTTSNETTYTFTSTGSAGTIKAVYGIKAKLSVSYRNGTTTSSGSLANASTTYHPKDETITITAPAISGYTFSKWVRVSGTTTPDINNATAASFDTKLSGDVVLIASYVKSYTLTVKLVDKSYVTVNGVTVSKLPVEVPAGSNVTITPDLSGARVFSKWTITGTMPANCSTTMTTSPLTFVMPAGNCTVEATYTADSSYTTKQGWLQVNYKGSALSATNAAYYAKGDTFSISDFEVVYFRDASSTGEVISSAADLDYYIYAHGTTTDREDWGKLNYVGTFDLVVVYRIGSTIIARTANPYDYAIVVKESLPQFIFIENAPLIGKTGIYRGDAVNMDGSTVYLGSLINNKYVGATVLEPGTYTVWPQWNKTKNTYVYADGTEVTGNTLNIVLAYNDPNQNNRAMKWVVPYAGIDVVKINEVASNVTLAPSSTYQYSTGRTDGDYMNASTKAFDATAKADGKWYITYGTTGTRTLTAAVGTVPNGTASDNIASWTNSDTAVVSIKQDATNPLKYTVTPLSSGEATITVKLKGSGETAKFLIQVLSSEAENTTAVTSFTLSPTSVNLYVGSTAVVTPTNFAPTGANTLIRKWETVYVDDGTSADYSVSVDATGTLTAKHYTSREIEVRAYPRYCADTTYYAKAAVTFEQVGVTNLVLTETSIKMFNKASQRVDVTVSPSGATNKTIIWASSNSSVVSVDVQGVLTANTTGTATITATSEDNPSVKKTIKVTVVASVLATDLTLSKSELTLGLNETENLTAYITPSTATTKNVTWTSDNAAVASVDANGKVRGLKIGIATVTASMNDGSGLIASCLVTVAKVMSKAVTLSKTGIALYEGETATVTATVYPTNVTTKGVVWSSSDEAVATVDANGEITAIKAGGAVITATAADGSSKYADCVVVVNAKVAVKGIALNLGNFDLLLNDSTTLTATISPANATYGTLKWTSSDTSVATVDEKGKVCGLKIGTAEITCTAGEMKKTITVTVATRIFSAGTVVNCSRRVNVRQKASGASKHLGYAYLGDTYKVLSATGNWYLIQYNATTTAYIWSRYLTATEGTKSYTSSGAVVTTPTTGTTGTTGTTTPTTSSKTITIINCQNCVNVRSGAGTTFTKLGYAYLGTTYAYTELTNGFYKISYAGDVGYVSASFAQANG